jgi:PTH1 family peptidyl-tRNA hydrolase
MNSMELSVFLGNPGKEYVKTRHNFGWIAGEALPSFRKLRLQSKFNGSWGDIKNGDHREIVLFPGTFMNRSGISVSAALSFFNIDVLREPESLLVVHDDLELPFGTVELRAGGGLAGHNGLKSIRDQLGTDSFLRLRLGIGRPVRGSVSSWVLSRFSPDEEARLPELLEEAAETLELLLHGGHRSAAPFRKEILRF